MKCLQYVLSLIFISWTPALSFLIQESTWAYAPSKISLTARYYQMSADLPAYWKFSNFRIRQNHFTLVNCGLASGVIRGAHTTFWWWWEGKNPRPGPSSQREVGLNWLQDFLLVIANNRLMHEHVQVCIKAKHIVS